MLEFIFPLLKKAIVFAVVFYVLAAGVLYYLQDSLLFPAPDVGSTALLPDARPVSMTASDGTILKHVRFAHETGPKLIFFHGNGDAAMFSQVLGKWFYRAGFDVLLAEYRGYGGSSGKPSAQKLLEDAIETYDWFAGKSDKSIYLFGHSLGSGIAAYLVANRPVAAAALVSSYSSLEDIAVDLYPIFPVKALIRHRIQPAKYLGETTIPVFVAHGSQDRVIPVKFGRMLFEAIGSDQKQWKELNDAGHNDIIDGQLISEVIRFFGDESEKQ